MTNGDLVRLSQATANPNSLTDNIYARIEEITINPTDEQAQACLHVCQWLSNCYKDIHLFRFDRQTGDVYILAGDELEIIVPPNGLWEFI